MIPIPQLTALLLFACSTSQAPDAPTPAVPAPVAPLSPAAPIPTPAPTSEDPAATSHGEHGEQVSAPVAVPTTLSEAIGALEQLRDEIEILVERGQLSGIHPLTEQMGKLAVLLPVRAKELPAADKNTVILAATDLKKILDALHHAADEGSADETRAELVRLDEQIAKLAAYE